MRFLSFYSPKPRNQVRILIYQNWRIVGEHIKYIDVTSYENNALYRLKTKIIALYNNISDIKTANKLVVSFAAVIRVVTQRLSPSTLITAAKETNMFLEKLTGKQNKQLE